MNFTGADRNPFASRFVDRLRFRDAEATVAGILAKWECLGSRGVIVGKHGTGKTTLLDAIHSELEGRGWIVVRIALRNDEPLPDWKLPKVAGRLAVLLDSAGVLGVFRRRIWRWMGRGAMGWIETAHADVGLPVIHETKTSERLLEDLADELAPGVCIPTGLFAKYQGNIRLAFRELYDRFG